MHKPDALYLIEAFQTRSAALDSLRGCEIRDERIYVIAENPQGNLDKDLIMIFEEAGGASSKSPTAARCPPLTSQTRIAADAATR